MVEKWDEREKEATNKIIEQLKLYLNNTKELKIFLETNLNDTELLLSKAKQQVLELYQQEAYTKFILEQTNDLIKEATDLIADLQK